MAEKEKKLTTREMDALWRKNQQEEGWRLPKKAEWYLRLPIVRYFRWYRLNLAVARHNRGWMRVGLIPTGYDSWVLYAIYRGWC